MTPVRALYPIRTVAAGLLPLRLLGVGPLTVEGEREGRDVMTLVDQHMTVLRDAVSDLGAEHETLDHRHVEPPVESVTSTAEGADLRRIEAEEAGELRHPLLHQRLAMNQPQRTASTGRDELRANDGLPAAGRRDEDPILVSRQRAHGFLLDRRDLTVAVGGKASASCPTPCGTTSELPPAEGWAR